MKLIISNRSSKTLLYLDKTYKILYRKSPNQRQDTSVCPG